MLYILIASLAVMVISLSGVAFTNRFIEKYSAYLITFSSGVFAIISWNLIHESIQHTESILFTGLFVTMGIGILALVDVFLPEGHHHHTDDEYDHNHSSPIGARKMLLGDAIHNAGDGIVLASAFLVSVPVGIATTVGIIVHELVQEISEFFVLRKAGYSKKKALLWNFIASTTIIVGAVGAYLLAGFEEVEEILVAIAAGAFLYIVLKDLIPSSIKNSIHERTYTKHILVFVLGIAVILLVSLIGGGHGH